MNDILSEMQYEDYIIEQLKNLHGYDVAPATEYDPLYAVNRRALFQFLEETQPTEITALRKIYKDETEQVIVAKINNTETALRGSRLDVLKHGVDISNIHLDLMYTPPATSFNQELLKKYQKNIFSVSKEVWASDKERVDLVIFLNGLAIIAIELKCNAAGQCYKDAIWQYRYERNPQTRLFLWKAGALVCFAMDLEEVHMTTKLAGASTYFLPFNMGRGQGVDTGKGNPIFEDKYSTFYMWENIFAKDSLLEIISKFMFVEVKVKKDAFTGKDKLSETLIFPRYHQLDVIRKLLADVKVNHSSQNYLLQHSPGSGKTNEIAWLAHRLSSLHDTDNKVVFDNIIVCTDRVVVDRQLQHAVMGIEHKSGLVQVMDDKCDSGDLKDAVEGNTKIIVTTIEKFPYIVDDVKGLKHKKFAVIIDEAHASTNGKYMSAVTKSLTARDEEDDDLVLEDILNDEISRNGKQENISFFAFTATPKATTLATFGRENSKGHKEAFHIYSMKQAIEEGFILDVLSNYITYETYYTLNKSIEEDPEVKPGSAKRQIARIVDLDETNINQRIEIIVEHFRNKVLGKVLNGNEKAMVITASREAAVRCRQAVEKYLKWKGYNDIHALVAFSGKVKLDGEDYTEHGMNGFSENLLPDKFDVGNYQLLLVADKYQTGFDQDKLCAMYILKSLRNINAVQTLSRLNRICPPYEKKTFILDFANEYEDIKKAFSKYYTVTFLANEASIKAIYDIEAKLDGYFFLDPGDIEKFNQLLYGVQENSNAKKQMIFLLQKAKSVIEHNNNEEGKKEIVLTMKRFLRLYEFLIQSTPFEDVELHKKYNFVSHLFSYMKVRESGGGYDLTGKLKAEGFIQKKTAEYTKSNMISDPVIKLPTAEQVGLTQSEKKLLSVIIEEINRRTGRSFDTDMAVKSMMQIKDSMMKSEDLRISAENNSVNDFELAYYRDIDDALIEGLEHNQEFFTLLLNDENLKKEVMGMFVKDIYNSLRHSVDNSDEELAKVAEKK